MAQIDVLQAMRTKNMTPAEFNFEQLSMPPIYYYLTPDDIDQLRKIATSLRLSSKIDQKYKMIDDIMVRRGFTKFAGGTNRIVYRFLDNPAFVAKIAIDSVGMKDNPAEYYNQQFLKPFVAKMFSVSPCGTVGFAERVQPITNIGEFSIVMDDVLDILIEKIIGRYVVDDVGSEYFMNWGIRMGFGPCLLDYPYVFQLDGNKLYCASKNLINNIECGGVIDYDAGFNNLRCTKCGKLYSARDLKDNNDSNKLVIIKGGIVPMKVRLNKDDETIAGYTGVMESDYIVKPTTKQSKKSQNEFKVVLTKSKEEDKNKRVFGQKGFSIHSTFLGSDDEKDGNDDEH